MGASGDSGPICPVESIEAIATVAKRSKPLHCNSGEASALTVKILSYDIDVLCRSTTRYCAASRTGVQIKIWLVVSFTTGRNTKSVGGRGPSASTDTQAKIACVICTK